MYLQSSGYVELLNYYKVMSTALSVYFNFAELVV